MKLIAALGLLIALAAGPALAEEAPDCRVATYRLRDGRLIDVGPEGKGLRWRSLDGRTGALTPQPGGGLASTKGWTDRPDGVSVTFGPCGSGTVIVDGMAGKAASFEVHDTRFVRDGVDFTGRLVLPKGATRVPVMVLGHGSERWSAVANGFRQRLYPAAGVGVFIFDKRGTGGSGGKYTQDFDVLAQDLAAAVAEARRLGGARIGRIGLQGGSQAGWVLPLASTKAKVDFVIVGYGIAAGPLTEDRTETLQDLAAAGWGAEVLAKAREVTDATGAVMASNFTGGFERFNAVVAKYRSEPWFKDLKGEFTGEMVTYSEAQIREVGPQRDEGTPWTYDAVGALARVTTPLLWMIAGADTEGAGEETPRNLLALRAEGRPFTVVEFPNTEHGVHLLETRGGVREQVAYAPGYFAMELDFAKHGRLTRAYPAARVLTAPRGAASN